MRPWPRTAGRHCWPQRRARFWRSVGEPLIARRISLVARCCRRSSRNSPSSASAFCLHAPSPLARWRWDEEPPGPPTTASRQSPADPSRCDACSGPRRRFGLRRSGSWRGARSSTCGEGQPLHSPAPTLALPEGGGRPRTYSLPPCGGGKGQPSTLADRSNTPRPKYGVPEAQNAKSLPASINRSRCSSSDVLRVLSLHRVQR